jgi:hypothetical protein
MTVYTYLNNNISITMDQYIMASIKILHNPEWLHLIYDPNISKSCPDKWFSFYPSGKNIK